MNEPVQGDASRESTPGARRSPVHRYRLALAAAVAGLVALTGAAVVACDSGQATDAGGDAARRLASATPPATGPSVPVRAGLPTGGAEPVRPRQLRIDKLGLTARVDPVGIDAATGDFAVPPSIDEVGWYRFGPGLDATAGSIVIAGHVDSAEQGRGAFFRLRDLGPGDRLAVTGTDGTTRSFTVVAREIYAKSSIPLERYFARDGAPRLTLITCGGPFDERTRSYRDNVVVTATPG